MPRELSIEKRIARVMSLYKRGIVTLREQVASIASLATRPGFFECLAGLPPEMIKGLRQIASCAPAHPEDVIDGIGHYSPMTKEEFRAVQSRERLLVYWEARLLRGHFFPDCPLPPFEPRRRVGVVGESTVVDSSVVLFGIENPFIIRDHPVHCVSPTDGRIITSVIQQRFVKGPGDEAGDVIRRQYGRPGLFLDTNVHSPSEVPAGSEVWVDRSAASEIPPLPDLESA